MTQGVAFFETAIGLCGVAWDAEGVVGLELPERDEASTRARLGRRFPGFAETTPDADAAVAIAAVQAMAEGRAPDLGTIRLDMRAVPEFDRRVYEIALAIPFGATMTYGAIAARMGQPGAARAVGRALGSNPFAPIVPCHRVLAAGGKSGGFSAAGGVTTKMRLLSIEGASLDERPQLFASLPLAVRQ